MRLAAVSISLRIGRRFGLMSGQPAELPDDRPNALDQLQRSGLVAALLAVIEQLRRYLPDRTETDTSIDWEDGEAHEDSRRGS